MDLVYRVLAAQRLEIFDSINIFAGEDDKTGYYFTRHHP